MGGWLVGCSCDEQQYFIVHVFTKGYGPGSVFVSKIMVGFHTSKPGGFVGWEPHSEREQILCL